MSISGTQALKSAKAKLALPPSLHNRFASYTGETLQTESPYGMSPTGKETLSGAEFDALSPGRDTSSAGCEKARRREEVTWRRSWRTGPRSTELDVALFPDLLIFDHEASEFTLIHVSLDAVTNPVLLLLDQYT